MPEESIQLQILNMKIAFHRETGRYPNVAYMNRQTFDELRRIIAPRYGVDWDGPNTPRFEGMEIRFYNNTMPCVCYLEQMAIADDTRINTLPTMGMDEPEDGSLAFTPTLWRQIWLRSASDYREMNLASTPSNDVSAEILRGYWEEFTERPMSPALTVEAIELARDAIRNEESIDGE